MVRVIAIAGIVLMHVLANGNYDLSGFLFEKVIGTAGNFTILFMMVSAFGMCCGYYEKFKAGTINIEAFYAESVKYFREENDGKLPSLKSLKKRKEELTKEIAERKKAYAPLREESRRLEIASDNVYSIFRKTNEMKSDLAWKREWETKVREKARQEQARQEQCERQPKRKKRSYDMSL